MCPACDGLGVRHDFDPDLLVPDPSLSVWDGAIEPLGPVKEHGQVAAAHLRRGRRQPRGRPRRPAQGDDAQGPLAQTSTRSGKTPGSTARATGSSSTAGRTGARSGRTPRSGPGVANELMAKFRNATGGPTRAQLEPYMRSMTCPDCQGARLNPRARAVRVGGKTLVELGAMPIGRGRPVLRRPGRPTASADLGRRRDGAVPLDPLSRTIAEELLKEIRGRLGFLINVGLHYLTLDRAAPTLSGGEAQRIRLASQIGAGLVGVLYILDEPTIGLHPRDNDRLIATLQRLRDMGNTVIVVEHDEDTMRAADYLVDFGPGPGVQGGEVVAAGTTRRRRRGPREPHRPVPLGPQGDRGPRRPQAADRPPPHDRRGPAEQPQEHRRRDPARACSSA